MRIPPGFNTIAPYLFVGGAARRIDFLVAGLGGVEIGRHVVGNRIANAQVRIGDSTLMISEASAAVPAMPASCDLYVDDADASMQRARPLREPVVDLAAAGGRAVLSWATAATWDERAWR